MRALSGNVCRKVTVVRMDKEKAIEFLGIISVLLGLATILSGIGLLSGLSTSTGHSVLIGIIVLVGEMPEGSSLAVIGTVLIVLGALFGYLGYLMYKGKKWAYHIYVSITMVSVIISIALKSTVGLFIGIFIIIYLYAIRVRDWR